MRRVMRKYGTCIDPLTQQAVRFYTTREHPQITHIRLRHAEMLLDSGKYGLGFDVEANTAALSPIKKPPVERENAAAFITGYSKTGEEVLITEDSENSYFIDGWTAGVLARKKGVQEPTQLTCATALTKTRYDALKANTLRMLDSE